MQIIEEEEKQSTFDQKVSAIQQKYLRDQHESLKIEKMVDIYENNEQ